MTPQVQVRTVPVHGVPVRITVSQHSVHMKAVLNRFHLAIRLGGDGFSNTEKIREVAFVVSLLQCAPAMYQFGISSGAAVGGATGIPGFDPAVASLRTMSEWEFIEHHLDITSAASRAEADYLPVTSPPTWCCSTFPTDWTSAQWTCCASI